MNFTNKVVVVTGAGQGIGACIATAYAAAGASVVIAEIDQESGLEVEESITSQGGHGVFMQTDVADEESVQAMVAKVNKRYGKIDILINNATQHIHSGETLFSRTVEDFERVMRVNLTGAYICVKYCTPYMMSEGCSIVNIASTRALMSEPHTEPYSASKGALLSLTHSLAASLSPRIRVNAISPGWIDGSQWKRKKDRKFVALRGIDHKQHLAGRVGVPEDVAQAALYLTSKEASFITGTNFVVDGGMSVKMIYEE